MRPREVNTSINLRGINPRRGQRTVSQTRHITLILEAAKASESKESQCSQNRNQIIRQNSHRKQKRLHPHPHVPQMCFLALVFSPDLMRAIVMHPSMSPCASLGRIVVYYHSIMSGSQMYFICYACRVTKG